MYVFVFLGDVAVLACVLVLPHLEDGVAVVRWRKHREGRALRRRRCAGGRRLQRQQCHYLQCQQQQQRQEQEEANLANLVASIVAVVVPLL